MWRPASRTRLALSLILGVFVGVSILALPALVFPASTQSESSQSLYPGRIDSLSAQPAMIDSQGTLPTETGSDRLAFAIRLFVVLLPASFLAIIARRWATRKLADYWYY